MKTLVFVCIAVAALFGQSDSIKVLNKHFGDYFSSHRPTYFISGFDSHLGGNQVKFDVSFKYLFLDELTESNNLKMFIFYRQLTFWDLWNAEKSRPIREHNYNPGVFFQFEKSYEVGNVKMRKIRLGFMHESNGEDETNTKTWDRAFLSFASQGGETHFWSVETELWLPLNYEDDNPELVDNIGYGEMRIYLNPLVRDSHENLLLSATLRTTSVRLNAYFSGFRLLGFEGGFVGSIKPSLVVEYFHGSGQSLELSSRSDRQFRVGIGLVF